MTFLLWLQTYWIAATIISIGIANEYVSRTKWTEAQSLFQGLGAFLLWFPGLGPRLAKFPWIGDVLRKVASKHVLPPTVWLPLVFLAFLSACGGLSPYYATLSGVEKAVNTAAQRYKDFDAAKRSQIVREAKNETDGLKALADWNATSIKLVAAIEGTDASVRLARDALVDIEKGVRSHAELSEWVGPILNTAKNLQALLASVGFVLPKEVH